MKPHRLLILVLLLTGISACRESEPSRPERVHSFRASFLPKPLPPEDGNFLVCIADRVEKEELHLGTIPAGLVFQGWGELQGLLTSDHPFDPTTMGTTPAKELLSYAVVTTGAITLGPDKRCARVNVRALMTETHMWSKAVVPAQSHFGFEAEDIELDEDFVMVRRKEDPPRSFRQDLIDSGVLHGFLLQDAADAVTMRYDTD